MRGDPRAFCEQLRPRLVGSLTLYCGDRAIAEELAHEALVRAFERWDRVGRMESPEAWTYRTAFNLARSWFRRRALERHAHRRLAARLVVTAPLPDSATAVAVRSAVAALPPRQRAVIVARFYGGLSVEETATALDCAEGTVKAHTHAALVRLRSAGLSDAEDDEVNDEEEVDARDASR